MLISKLWNNADKDVRGGLIGGLAWGLIGGLIW